MLVSSAPPVPLAAILRWDGKENTIPSGEHWRDRERERAGRGSRTLPYGKPATIPAAQKNARTRMICTDILCFMLFLSSFRSSSFCPGACTGTDWLAGCVEVVSGRFFVVSLSPFRGGCLGEGIIYYTTAADVNTPAVRKIGAVPRCSPLPCGILTAMNEGAPMRRRGGHNPKNDAKCRKCRTFR